MTTVAFDTETRGLDWFEADQGPFLVTWSDEAGDYLAHVTDPAAMDRFKAAMRAADVVVAHNLPFDVHHLREHCDFDVLVECNDAIDTALLARVVLPERRTGEGIARGFGLEELSRTFLPEADQKVDLAAEAKAAGIRLKITDGYYNMWRAHPDILEHYAMMDTRATLELLPHLMAKLTARLRPTWELEAKLQPHLIWAEARGIKVDQAKVQPLKEAYTHKRDWAYANVRDVLGVVIGDPDNPEASTNPEELSAALINAGVPLYRTTETGQLATNKFALQEFASEHAVVQDLFDYRQAAKFLSTYIGPMDGREVVHGSIWQLGPWTGRMSMSRPNMQNIPVRGEGSSALREMFVPRPGHVFVVSDYDQIELRLLAYYLDDWGFIEKIERGDDVFAELAAYLWDGEAADYYKGTAGAAKRSEAKNTTYAISYGAGGARISDMLGLPTGPPLSENAWVVQRGYQQAGDPSHQAARKIIAQVKSWLPGYEALAGRKGRTYKKIARDGFVSTINGRKQIVGRDKQYVGLNALIQGSAADIFKQGIINVAEATAHLGAVPVLFVHDEVVSECPVEHAEECLRLQDQAMREAWDLTPALAVSGGIAHNNYAEAK